MTLTLKQVGIIFGIAAAIIAAVSFIVGPLNILENKPPVARIDAPSSASVGIPVKFLGTQSYDPDGSIIRYRWVFDDEWKDDTSAIITRQFELPRTYTVTLTVFDDKNASNEWEKFIKIQPYPGEQKIVVSDVKPVDEFGKSVPTLSINQQVQIAAELKNISNSTQEFAYVVEIKDNTGKHVSISWITGALDAGQSFNPSLGWIPQSSGRYIATISVWDSPESLVSISNEEIIELRVS